MAQLILKHIEKIYPNGFHAIHDFNLEVEDGEFIVFVGPSGCGKSTVLRMIAGLEEISEGEMYIGQQLVNEVEPKDRDIAMVFQNYALYPHKNVYDNLAFGLMIRKTDPAVIEQKVQEAAEILGLTDLLDRKPSQLSGGQRQRVALGRAIVRDPEVFLMDEPLSNLDAALRVKMRTEILKLHHEIQSTMIYVTHDQTEAMTMGDRIVVLNQGVIQQVGTPRQIYNNPTNLFVANFMGSPNINFMTPTVQGDRLFLYDQEILPQQDLTEVVTHELICGFRPENIALVPGDDFTVTITENLGSQIFVHLANEIDEIIVAVDNFARYESGDQVSIEIKNPDIINVFDQKTEEKLVDQTY